MATVSGEATPYIGTGFDDMVGLEDSVLSISSFCLEEAALPRARWCRYCGNAAFGDEAWRMSCEGCWQYEAPSAFAAARIYGTDALRHLSNTDFILSSA